MCVSMCVCQVHVPMGPFGVYFASRKIKVSKDSKVTVHQIAYRRGFASGIGLVISSSESIPWNKFSAKPAKTPKLEECSQCVVVGRDSKAYATEIEENLTLQLSNSTVLTADQTTLVWFLLRPLFSITSTSAHVIMSNLGTVIENKFPGSAVCVCISVLNRSAFLTLLYLYFIYVNFSSTSGRLD